MLTLAALEDRLTALGVVDLRMNRGVRRWSLVAQRDDGTTAAVFARSLGEAMRRLLRLLEQHPVFGGAHPMEQP